MRTGLIAGSAVLVVAVVFIIQNAHSANMSFLGVHLVLPLVAIAGALLMAAAGPPESPSSGRSSGVPCAKPGSAKQPTTNPLPADPPRQMTRERVSRP
jgi:hypothetical protein